MCWTLEWQSQACLKGGYSMGQPNRHEHEDESIAFFFHVAVIEKTSRPLYN
jgi:hypothetical protein